MADSEPAAVSTVSWTPGGASVRWRVDERTLLVVVDGDLRPADVAWARTTLPALLAAGAVDRVRCDLRRLGRADLLAIDLLARVRLLAARHGCRARFEWDSTDLRGLCALVGLDGVLLAIRPAGAGEGRRRGLLFGRAPHRRVHGCPPRRLRR